MKIFGNELKGMKEISEYVKFSDSTILIWIREMDFPAHKDEGGIWKAKKKDIDRFMKKMDELGLLPKKIDPKKKKRKVNTHPRRW